MKKNDWLILIATAAYSYLFYEQGAGVNFFIFSVLMVILSAVRDPKVLRQLPWIISAAGAIVSGFGIFYYSTWLALYANFVSLMILGAYSFDAETSFFIAFINSAFSVTTSVIGMVQQVILRSKNTDDPQNMSNIKRLLLLIVPILIALVFLVLYRESNPLFEEVTNQIDLDFISFGWLFFTFLGLLLVFGFFYHRDISFLTNIDKSNPDNLEHVSEEQHSKSFFVNYMSLPSEIFSGIALLALLNLLLFFANSVDVFYLYIKNSLPVGLTEAQRLHDGTNSLIFSILLAIAVILFFFRGRINFIENNRTIKLLAYLWICQNAFLILTTLHRNYIYVGHYGITQKRIGVYIFLSLCLVGLATTIIKVLSVKSNWYMFRKNMWVWYGTLVVSCIINWDGLIVSTNLRLGYEKRAEIDYNYLGYLSPTALPAFYRFYAAEPAALEQDKIQHASLIQLVKAQSARVVEDVKKADWQSVCLIKRQTVQEIENQQGKVSL